ncbi:hypothetical protein [Humibacter albus]|uniref:hypothetical protein n=1 Tax=Humibacter albus TaxID=427754 RepID=UPI0003B7B509|nr:hypothetical protein [Humibacter albus]
MSYYPAPTPPASAARPAPAGNLLGVVSFVFALATVAFDILRAFGLTFLVRVTPAGLYTVVSWTGTALVAMLALGALIIGILALLRKGAPKGFAAAGTALGAQALLAVLVGLAQTGLYSLMY